MTRRRPRLPSLTPQILADAAQAAVYLNDLEQGDLIRFTNGRIVRAISEAKLRDLAACGIEPREEAIHSWCVLIADRLGLVLTRRGLREPGLQEALSIENFSEGKK